MPKLSVDQMIGSKALRADLLLLLVTWLAAFGWMFSKEALTEFPPLLFIGIRFLLAGLLLAIPGWQQLQQLTMTDWITCSRVGILFAIAMIGWVLGLASAEFLAEGSFLISLAVPLVPIISWLLFREQLATRHLFALPLALTGLALLSLHRGFQLETSQLFFIGASMLLAVTFILNGRAAQHIPAYALSAIQLLLVGILGLCFSYLFEAWPSQLTSSMILWLSLSIVIATAMRFYIQTLAQGMASPSHAAAIFIVEPIWTGLLAALWFDERMLLLQYLGCTLIFCALLTDRWRIIRQGLSH